MEAFAYRTYDGDASVSTSGTAILIAPTPDLQRGSGLEEVLPRTMQIFGFGKWHDNSCNERQHSGSLGGGSSCTGSRMAGQ
jgi:hypothetical protein